MEWIILTLLPHVDQGFPSFCLVPPVLSWCFSSVLLQCFASLLLRFISSLLPNSREGTGDGDVGAEPMVLKKKVVVTQTSVQLVMGRHYRDYETYSQLLTGENPELHRSHGGTHP